MLDVPGHGVAWLKVASYAAIKGCELEWRRLNGEVSEEEVPGEDDIPDNSSLELLLQRPAGLDPRNQCC